MYFADMSRNFSHGAEFFKTLFIYLFIYLLLLLQRHPLAPLLSPIKPVIINYQTE